MLTYTTFRAIVRLTAHIKIRTYSQSGDELWYDEWQSPLCTKIPVTDPANLLQVLSNRGDQSSAQYVGLLLDEPSLNTDMVRVIYFDKLTTGFVAWGTSIKGYRSAPSNESALKWERPSEPALRALNEAMDGTSYFTQLASLLGQESTKNPTTLELRAEHVIFMKSIGM